MPILHTDGDVIRLQPDGDAVLAARPSSTSPRLDSVNPRAADAVELRGCSARAARWKPTASFHPAAAARSPNRAARWRLMQKSSGYCRWAVRRAAIAPADPGLVRHEREHRPRRRRQGRRVRRRGQSPQGLRDLFRSHDHVAQLIAARVGVRRPGDVKEALPAGRVARGDPPQGKGQLVQRDREIDHDRPGGDPPGRLGRRQRLDVDAVVAEGSGIGLRGFGSAPSTPWERHSSRRVTISMSASHPRTCCRTPGCPRRTPAGPAPSGRRRSPRATSPAGTAPPTRRGPAPPGRPSPPYGSSGRVRPTRPRRPGAR